MQLIKRGYKYHFTQILFHALNFTEETYNCLCFSHSLGKCTFSERTFRSAIMTSTDDTSPIAEDHAQLDCDDQDGIKRKKATKKGCEYQLELKLKSLGEAWRSLKSVSEELRSFMAEKRSVREAKVLYARWMDLYEAFVQANNAYCFPLSEDARKDHLVSRQGYLDIKCQVKH